MIVTIVGMGCGPGTLTEEASHSLDAADLIIGSKRLLSLLPPLHAEQIAEYRADRIRELLQARTEELVCVLVSGDSGFRSAASSLAPPLREAGLSVRLLPGISSVQLLSARLARPWQAWRLCTAHGTEHDVLSDVMSGSDCFYLTSDGKTPGEICHALEEAGLGTLGIAIGENLGLPEEQILSGTAASFAGKQLAPLNCILIDAAFRPKFTVPGIPDEKFLRGAAPMTKQAVRCMIPAALSLRPGDLCWDIGAGTGSVSVELALQSRGVWAVEKSQSAISLSEENRRRFGCWNLHIVAGTAPEALAALPPPDAVFIGGSGGRLEEIVLAVTKKNPHARICISAVTLETVSLAPRVLAQAGLEVQTIQLSASRAEPVGHLHLLRAENPVFLISGRPPCKS